MNPLRLAVVFCHQKDSAAALMWFYSNTAGQSWQAVEIYKRTQTLAHKQRLQLPA